jgi:hypothetical protein
MKPKDRKKKKSWAKKIKTGVFTVLQMLGVLFLIYGWPFLMKPKQQPVVPGYKPVSFQSLSAFNADEFKQRLKVAMNSNQPPDLPLEVKALNGEKVAVMGYMLPLEVDAKGVKTFALVRDLASCCFGGSPKLNEWVYVTMHSPQTAKHTGYSAIVVSGIFEVGAQKMEAGDTSLYRMTADLVQKV